MSRQFVLHQDQTTSSCSTVHMDDINPTQDPHRFDEILISNTDDK